MRPALREALARSADRVFETHVSWVFLRGDRALKLKKPVDFGFLDFRSVEARRRACEAEVRLNARLAPGVYLRAVPLALDAGGAVALGVHDAEAEEWAVEMVRLEDGRRADLRLAQGQLDVRDVDRVAAALAAFHAVAARGPAVDALAMPDAVAVNVRENFAQTRGAVERFVSAEEASEIERWQLGVLETRRAAFEGRVRAGHACDGHGDLRLEHVYLDTGVPGEGPVTIIDCIEFNERFRWADACADVAFLSMDLAWHGRTDLAERLLARYARDRQDFDLYALVDFYESYRAYVRGKVATFVANDARAPEPVRERAGHEARRYFLLALAAERRRVAPGIVVAVGGLVGSGKSTLADAISVELEAPVIDTDRTRKWMLGVAPTADASSRPEAYAPATTARVYDEVLRRAGVVVGSGRPVVLDGTFRGRIEREAARALARRAGLPFLFVECRVEPAVARARLEARGGPGGHASDARAEQLARVASHWEPADELPRAERAIVRTEGSVDASLAAIRARLPAPA